MEKQEQSESDNPTVSKGTEVHKAEAEFLRADWSPFEIAEGAMDPEIGADVAFAESQPEEKSGETRDKEDSKKASNRDISKGAGVHEAKKWRAEVDGLSGIAGVLETSEDGEETIVFDTNSKSNFEGKIYELKDAVITEHHLEFQKFKDRIAIYATTNFNAKVGYAITKMEDLTIANFKPMEFDESVYKKPRKYANGDAILGADGAIIMEDDPVTKQVRDDMIKEATRAYNSYTQAMKEMYAIVLGQANYTIKQKLKSKDLYEIADKKEDPIMLMEMLQVICCELGDRIPIRRNYPKDTYSFIALFDFYGKNSKKFWFGVSVFVLQVALLLVMLLSTATARLRVKEIDNPDSEEKNAGVFPANTTGIVRAAQIVSLIAFVYFPEEGLLDVKDSIEFLSWRSANRKLYFSCILRFLQGMLSVVAVFYLVMISSEVNEIILNYTAVNFISRLDNCAFDLAENGYYGIELREATKVLKEKEIQTNIDNRKRNKFTMGFVSLGLFIGVCYVVISQLKADIWTTQVVRVQFEKNADSDFNGCYEIDEGDRHHQRYIYKSYKANKAKAKIGYCKDERRWILFEDNSLINDPCDAFKPNYQEYDIARSPKSDFFDIESSMEEQWVDARNAPIGLTFLPVNNSNPTESCDSFFGNGEGKCDPIFNTHMYNYDEGECCAYTCSGEKCGVVDGSDDSYELSYPNCKGYGNDYSDFQPITVSLIDFDGDSYFQLKCDENRIIFRQKMNKDKNKVSVYARFDEKCSFKPTDDTFDEDYTVQIAYGFDETQVDVNILSSFNLQIFEGNELSAQNITLKMPSVDDLNELAVRDLEGSIPGDIGLLTTLTRLDLGDNSLTGSIPSEIGELTGLTYLDLGDNSLTGSIPSEIGQLTSLVSLYLEENYPLSGSIPSEIGELTSLTYLDLANNYLKGSIPSEIGQLTSLTYLDLQENYPLTGSIPSEIGELTSLTELYFGYSRLTGSIPSEIGELTSLVSLYLGQQILLTGSIPSEIGELTSLTELYLRINHLTGFIPSEIGELTSLINLDLRLNYLTGSFPSEIGQLTSLISLDLRGNSLTGSIPSEIGELTSLVYLVLSNNYLKGSIPSEIGQLTSLVSLYLDGTSLTGSIPSEIGELTSLTELYLGDNSLTGSIPSEIGELTGLTYLELHGTSLTGSIPSEIGE